MSDQNKASDTTSIAIFSKAAVMLAEADTIQKAKELKSLALTAAEWAKRKNMGEEAIQHCRSYALEAERKMGQMLKETERAKGAMGNPGGRGAKLVRSQDVTAQPTLLTLGITKRESAEAQMLAELSENEFMDVKAGKKTKAKVKKEKQLAIAKKAYLENRNAVKSKPQIVRADAVGWLKDQGECDLLLTDPPYCTDVDDIETFAARWLPLALSKVKPTGRAFVFVGAYPQELFAYLRAAMPTQILVWTYRNTIGPCAATQFNLNWQAILYYCGADAQPLQSPILTEHWAVQDVNAPDGRQGNRIHKWQKPDELAERLIRMSTQPGQIVFDPFCGSGTFLMAAGRLGLSGFGCDIEWHE